jgi:hypothetical protein
VATAVEAYHVDNNRYPANTTDGFVPRQLTTPIAFISQIPNDVFRTAEPGGPKPLSYDNVRENVDNNVPNWPPNDLKRYGDWRLYSLGPQRVNEPWIPYDPTNGTVSAGAILRTQISAEGRIPFTFWDPANPNE